MRISHVAVSLLVVAGLIGTAHAHTVDSVGPYRVEIGWLNEPVVSGNPNAIELYVSPLEPGLELEEQVFEDGIKGLRKDIRIQLAFKGETVTLPLWSDHNVAGKYYAFVNPTVAGFYQANVLGQILDTPISLSMHPPEVRESEHIEFPEPANREVRELTAREDALAKEIEDLKGIIEASKNDRLAEVGQLMDRISELEASMGPQLEGAGSGMAGGMPDTPRPLSTLLQLAGIGLGMAGIAVGAVALARSRS